MRPLAFVLGSLLLSVARPQAAPELCLAATIQFGVGIVTHVALNPAGTLAALATTAGEVVCVNPRTRVIERRWRAPSSPIAHLQFAVDGGLDLQVADPHGTGAKRQVWVRMRVEGSVERWGGEVIERQGDVAAWRERFHAGHDFYGSDLIAVSASGGGDVCVALWNRRWVQVFVEGTVRDLVDSPTCTRIALTPDARWIVAALTTRVLVTPLGAGTAFELPIEATTVRQVAAAGVGPEFAVVTDRDVMLWNASTRRELRRLPLPTHKGMALPVWEASSSGEMLAMRGWYDSLSPAVAVLDLNTGKWREYPVYHGSLSWSVDGNTLLVGTGRYGCCIMEGTCVRCIPRHAGEMDLLHLAIDGVESGDLWIGAVPGKPWCVAECGAAACVQLGSGRVRGQVGSLPRGPRLVWSSRWLLSGEDARLVWRTLPDLEAGPDVAVAAPPDALVAVADRGCVVAAVPGALQVFKVERRKRAP